MKNLTYVCFSQGCTQFLVMGSLKPEYNKKIRFAVALSPASFMKNIKGFILHAQPFVSFSKVQNYLSLFKNDLINSKMIVVNSTFQTIIFRVL